MGKRRRGVEMGWEGCKLMRSCWFSLCALREFRYMYACNAGVLC